MNDLTSPNIVQPVLVRIAKIMVSILVSLCFLLLVAYGVVYTQVRDYIEALARNYYWIHSALAVSLAATAALVVSWPILWAQIRVSVGRGKASEHAIIALSLAASLLTAYVYRHKYFRSGNDPLYVCAPILPDDSASIEHIGEGESEGRRCIKLTHENAAVARAIDRQKAPKLVPIPSLTVLHNLVWFKNGTPAIYIGHLEGQDGLPKLYDGPGFDPETPEFLIPVSVEIINRIKAKQQQKEEKQAIADQIDAERRKLEADEQAKKDAEDNLIAAELERVAKANAQAEAAQAEEEQRRRNLEARQEREQREQAARAEQERRETSARLEQDRREQRQQVIASSRRRINLEGRGAFAIPPGYWATEYGSSIYFMLGDRRVDTPNLGLFKQYNGQLLAIPAAPQYIFRQPNSDWVIIQLLPE